ncbi:MAG: hypothetical protein HND51_15825 [Chloroflexi bacterium]|nr:hypothetical protein [Chloroflexota bacterium]NOH13108.1 hypothetical protein [Chloroflexota bacterium]
MCVCVAPARLSNTIILASAFQNNGTIRHVMGYQNRPQSQSGPNAMLLPIPAVPNSVSPKDLILTEDFSHILKDMAAAIHPPTRAMPKSFQPQAVSAQAVVFEHGIYTVVLAQNASAIAPALDQVPEDKRPPLNNAVFDAYTEWYPDWAIALCCFNNADLKEGQPILLTFEPLYPDRLFCPGLDSHTGDVPDLRAAVMVDHTLVLNAPGMERGYPVSYRDEIPEELDSILPTEVIGNDFGGSLTNGDWWFELDQVEQGHFNSQRITPPFT